MTAAVEPLRLVLVRHGRAEGNDPRLPDFERALDPRGQAEAASLGRRLRARGIDPQAVLVSPARRTLATAGHLLESMEASPDLLRPLPQLYLAGVESLAGALRDEAGDARCVVLVAHNPGISDFAEWLAPSTWPSGFATGEARIMDLVCARWADVARGSAIGAAREPGHSG